MSVNGILNLCKPPGCTSFDLVRRTRWLIRQKKVGHGGTLDPLASGVLPICVGQATRITEFLAESDKTYEASVVLGVATDTYDAEGGIVGRGDPSSITRQDLEEALKPFRGLVEQVPPMYSALKHQGKRLYDLARAGVVVEREKRKGFIHGLEIIGWDSPVVTLEITSGRGIYIRTLADDLGKALGCGAHLKTLIRRSTGPFRIEESMGLDDLAVAVEEGRWQEILFPVDFALSSMNAVILDPKAERAAMAGQPIPVIYAEYLQKARPHTGSSAQATLEEPSYRSRAYSQDGRFLAVLSAPTPRGPWVPKKVFSLS